MLNDINFLDALYEAGVDKWEWHDDVLSHLPPDTPDDKVLSELIKGGVDEWEDYDIAIDIYQSKN